MSSKPSRVSRPLRPVKPRQPASHSDFWKTKSLEELAAEQGVPPIERLEDVLGQGAGLWSDDAELESFLAALRERRRKGG